MKQITTNIFIEKYRKMNMIKYFIILINNTKKDIIRQYEIMNILNYVH